MRSVQPNDKTEVRSPRDLRGHRKAALVPSMTVAEFKALLADIARRGIVVPLDITATGVVLDGRHRHRAALELGLEAVPVRIVAPKDEIDFMLSAAIDRRHLGASQRAALEIQRDEHLQQRAEAAARRNGNLRNGDLDVAKVPHREGRTRDHAARRAGVSPRLIQDAIRVKGCDADLFEEVRAGKIPLRRALQRIERAERYGGIGPSPPLPNGNFDLIVADPAWQTGWPGAPWSPEQHYPTMPTEEIAALKVPAAENAILFVWILSSRLQDGLDVSKAWGFIPKTTMVWDKEWIGPGNYLRNRHELVLIATRGKYPFPAPEDRPDSVFREQRTGHSVKPQLFYELIERMYPNATRLEMFARGKTRPGWTSWGNQVID